MSEKAKFAIKEPYNLSPRIQWLRDYYFKGAARNWKNEALTFTNGELWDQIFCEMGYYIVPESYAAFDLQNTAFRLGGQKVPLCDGFWDMSLIERRAWFNKEVMVNHLPQDMLPGDLLCGARFNMMTSRCLNEEEVKARRALIVGPEGTRTDVFDFHDRGYGNYGATSGHLIADYADILRRGFKGIQEDLDKYYAELTEEEKQGERGQTLRAMKTAATMPVELAQKYTALCLELAAEETDPVRKAELEEMAKNMQVVPYEPAQNFWQAMQSLWMTHMLVLADENYPGAGVSFGRLDQYLLPYWEKSLAEGMDREFGKEILKCWFIHCNTAYDFGIASGNQGITAGFGQLFTIGGMGPGGKDMTNDLTWVLLEVIDEMSPILEPKPNVRLHRNSPPELISKVAEMLAKNQGAPFLLNFDERSMAGMLRQGKMMGLEHLINKDNVHDYASVGCLENTMVGNDRSATVDVNLNLIKAVELALGNGYDISEYYQRTNRGQPFDNTVTDAPQTGDPCAMETFEEFFQAFSTQLTHLIQKVIRLYNKTDYIRGTYAPTPYLSCLVRGCAEKGKDITRGGAQIRCITIEGVSYGTTIDSLLAIKYLVFDKKICTMAQLIGALKANWVGHEVLQAMAVNRAPKYGRDDDEADELGRRVMELWSSQLWGYKTPITDATYRGGMLSWNYWVGDGYIVGATPNGRARGQFLSNAICPSNGADTNGPTANINSVGKVLGGRGTDCDYEGYVNYLPNGSSHTITLNPSLVRDDERREKFEALLRGYIENGGTALQINVLDPEMLIDAQKHPENYRNLLVRVTGYNAYFTSVGRELQNEIIARESHRQF